MLDIKPHRPRRGLHVRTLDRRVGGREDRQNDPAACGIDRIALLQTDRIPDDPAFRLRTIHVPAVAHGRDLQRTLCRGRNPVDEHRVHGRIHPPGEGPVGIVIPHVPRLVLGAERQERIPVLRNLISVDTRQLVAVAHLAQVEIEGQHARRALPLEIKGQDFRRGIPLHPDLRPGHRLDREQQRQYNQKAIHHGLKF